MKSVFPILLLALAFCMACVHQPEEIPSLPTLPLFKDVTPISQIKEPGCELQMELDPLWHHNQYRDSNYIRDLVVNPKNSNQWIYIQSILKPDKNWNILWFVDVEKREKKQLDSVSFMGYGDLTWGGQFVGFELGNGVGIINIENGASLAMPNTSYAEISPTGKFILYAQEGKSLIGELSDEGVSNTRVINTGSAFSSWLTDYSLYTLKTDRQSGERELIQVNVQTDSSGIKASIPKFENGLSAKRLTLDKKAVLFNRHILFEIESQSFRKVFPYCERQYFEKIIHLTKTREYLVIKEYYETIEPKTTLWYQHFHVFDENWENERRVTLNFDF